MSEKRALGAEIFRERKYPFLGHLRKDEKVAALTLTSMLALLCFNAEISNSEPPRQYCLCFNAASDVPLAALLWAALLLPRCSGGCSCPDAKGGIQCLSKQKLARVCGAFNTVHGPLLVSVERRQRGPDLYELCQGCAAQRRACLSAGVLAYSMVGCWPFATCCAAARPRSLPGNSGSCRAAAI
jgi:hypothetical protein